MANTVVWYSVHLYDVHDTNEFISVRLAPFMERSCYAGVLRRWFFIRYHDSRHHLRVRCQLSLEHDCDCFRSSLYRMLSECPIPPSPRSLPYSRVRHYFGECYLSVRSEVLNCVLTRCSVDWLRFRCAPSLNAVHQLLQFVVCLVSSLESKGSLGAAVLEAYIMFVQSNTSEIPGENSPRLIHRLVSIDPPIVEMAHYVASAILANARYDEANLSMCSHALHLFYNRLGVTLDQERRLLLLSVPRVHSGEGA